MPAADLEPRQAHTRTPPMARARDAAQWTRDSAPGRGVIHRLGWIVVCIRRRVPQYPSQRCGKANDGRRDAIPRIRLRVEQTTTERELQLDQSRKGAASPHLSSPSPWTATPMSTGRSGESFHWLLLSVRTREANIRRRCSLGADVLG